MVAPLTLLGKAEGTQSKGRVVLPGGLNNAANNTRIIKAGTPPKDTPARSRLDMRLANFGEIPKGEVRRITILGNSVNKPEVWFLTNLAHSPGYLLASTENFEDHPA